MGLCCSGGRKDAFPGADGSTITQEADNNAQTIPMYGAIGNELTEGSKEGIQLIDGAASGVIGNDNTSFIYVIKNPLSYICNATIFGDWYASSESYQNHTLWEDGKKKSEFDPCPKGWRVPTDSEKTFGDFLTTVFSVSSPECNVANGRIYRNMAWFPMTGYRNYVSGVLGYVGSRGHYWSASVSSTGAKLLYFHISNVRPSSYNVRAWGLSVRCVQE